MPPLALGLLLLAAALHALWNLLVKRAGEKQIFTWWALAREEIIAGIQSIGRKNIDLAHKKGLHLLCSALDSGGSGNA